MFTRSRWGIAALAAAVLVFSGCGATADRAEPGAGGGEATSQQAITGLRFMVPNTPGSGYDTTAREAAKVMEQIGVTKGIEVFNLAGAGGTTGLSRTVQEKGNGKLIMMMGLGVVGAQYTNKSTEHARPDHADREADRGGRGHRGGQELQVHQHHRPGE